MKKSKQMKSVRITFRLSPYQLARGLQTIRQLESSYKLISLNDMVKTVYHDYLAKMSLNKNESIPLDFVAEIESFIARPNKATSTTLDDLIATVNPAIKPEPVSESESEIIHDSNDPENDSDLTDEILAEIQNISKIHQQADAHNLEKDLPSTFNDPNDTDSDISSVTDFTPPTDWKKD